MKAEEITIGGEYIAKVSGSLTIVRVDGISAVPKFSHSNYTGKNVYRDATVYACTNLKTGRHLSFRSAAKFRRVANDAVRSFYLGDSR